ncbi:hypothetical protein chiPu_0019016 [Chiloscyllium punctatum]|uniref:Uncharacterized protein n=1 Tax=Chiloscyllium punctatum TaxID=137246 RepID=A0A401RQL4_CHIPU|nr:hypothetical protein [Chiloscyllium punctatum]
MADEKKAQQTAKKGAKKIIKKAPVKGEDRRSDELESTVGQSGYVKGAAASQQTGPRSKSPWDRGTKTFPRYRAKCDQLLRTNSRMWPSLPRWEVDAIPKCP